VRRILVREFLDGARVWASVQLRLTCPTRSMEDDKCRDSLRLGLVVTLSVPWGVATVNPVKARHAVRGDLAAKREYIAGIGRELNVVAIDKALELAVLVRAVEGAGDDVALLRNLNRLQ
jgi:hypothetical protein